ncbi:hypothetical protein E2542_SST00795 [Spatholobus suberectus]|nr:hypothetical protein E2542_SST00795 [Spatholobus suberectus]
MVLKQNIAITAKKMQSRFSSKLQLSCDGVALFVTSFVVLPRVSTTRSVTFSGKIFTRHPRPTKPPIPRRHAFLLYRLCWMRVHSPSPSEISTQSLDC